MEHSVNRNCHLNGVWANGRTVLFSISQDKLYCETNNDQTKGVFIAHTEKEEQKMRGERNSNRKKNPHTRTHIESG